MNEKKKRVYHVELDVVDDVEKFKEESGDKGEDIEVLPTAVMIGRIEQAVTRFSKLRSQGVYVTNVEVTMPIISGIEIDRGIAKLVEKLWKVGVRTYESCEGGLNEEEEWEDAWIVMHKDGFEEAKKILPKTIRVEEGAGGYDLSDFNEELPNEEDCLFVSWNVRR